MDSGKAVALIEDNEGPDGSRTQVQVIKTPFRDEASNVVGILGTYREETSSENTGE